MATYSTSDFNRAPMVVFYEVTQACDLACQHCRACAQPLRDPGELTRDQAKDLFAQLAAFPKPPVLVLTGGDPLKRSDVFDLVCDASKAGLEVAMTPSATPLVTPEALRRLRNAGLQRLAVSLDGVDSATHDSFRGVAGSFDRTLQIIRDARAIGFPVQVNTTVVQRNVDQLERMAELLAEHDIVLWSVFFLVPIGRGLQQQSIAPDRYEQVFEQLWTEALRRPFGIKTTEAHHYRRWVLQHKGDPQRGGAGQPRRAPIGIRDGMGVMFVSHTDTVYPSGFLPIPCGQFPRDNVVEVYQSSPILKSIRDPEQLKGKCGRCEYRKVCGGSRARAFAVTGDWQAEEPDCTWEPRTEFTSLPSPPRRAQLPIVR